MFAAVPGAPFSAAKSSSAKPRAPIPGRQVCRGPAPAELVPKPSFEKSLSGQMPGCSSKEINNTMLELFHLRWDHMLASVLEPRCGPNFGLSISW